MVMHLDALPARRWSAALCGSGRPRPAPRRNGQVARPGIWRCSATRPHAAGPCGTGRGMSPDLTEQWTEGERAGTLRVNVFIPGIRFRQV